MIVWGRRLGDEFWSSVVSPLTFGLLAEVMAEQMLRRPLRAAGLRELAEEPVFRHFAGRVYVNLRLAEALFALLPRPLRVPGLLSLLPAEAEARLERAPAVSATTVRALAGLIYNDRSWLPWRHADLFRRSAASVEDEFGQPLEVGALAGARAEDLYRLLIELNRPVGHYLEVVGRAIGSGYLFFHVTEALIKRWVPLVSCGLWPDLTVGLGGIRPQKAAREVAAFARRFRALLEPGGSIASGEELKARIKQNQRAAQALETLLSEHGHRMTGRDLSMPSWREAPEIVLGLARKSLAGSVSAGDSLVRRKVAEARLTAALQSRFKHAVVTALLDYCRQYCSIREEMRYVADYFLCRMRRLALAIGDRLVKENRLMEVNDVFYLEPQEVERAVAGGELLDKIAHARSAAYQRLGRERAPEFAIGDQPATVDRSLAGERMSGEAASPGKARGRACLVTRPSELDAILPGDILVAGYADPSWIPALAGVAAVVLESGGQLSHGAIMARELGIPALVDVANATERLKTGDIVAVDTDCGTVTLVARSGPPVLG